MRHLKHKLANLFLLAEIMILVAICVIGDGNAEMQFEIYGIPYSWVADLVRNMSIGSATGNVFAWILYVAFCGIPVIIFIVKVIMKKIKIEDSLLLLLSAVMFGCIYGLINKWMFYNDERGPIDEALANGVMGTTISAVLVGYIFIKVLCIIKKDTSKAKIGFFYVLFALNAHIILNVFGEELNNLLINIKEVNMYTEAFYIANYVMEVITNIAFIILVMVIQSIVIEMDINNISQSIISKAQFVSIYCMISILCIIAGNIVLNILQIIFLAQISFIKVTIAMPFILVMVMMVCMILAKIILKNKEIKAENDMFI